MSSPCTPPPAGANAQTGARALIGARLLADFHLRSQK